MQSNRLLVYFFRRDLRASDNPILHHLSTASDHGFTHLLPVFVFPAHQIEISGFLKKDEKSPYPQALSRVGKFWRCGPHRAKFLAESVWDMKNSLESLGSGLVLRAGRPEDVLKDLIQALKEQGQNIDAVWMTEEKSDEEIREANSIASVCLDQGIEFKQYLDEKYFIDDRDTSLKEPQDLPDIFTTFRKAQEPLISRPRPSLPRPEAQKLPAFPSPDDTKPPQSTPFVVPETYDDLEERLLRPLNNILPNPPKFPQGVESAHPFKGGETKALERLDHLTKGGYMTTYHATRNGLAGLDFSTKLSAYLALGSITARRVHEALVAFEEGKDSRYESTEGYGDGENYGTKSVRVELLWRDYMRLCTIKFGTKLFKVSGFRHDENTYDMEWKTNDEKVAAPNQEPSPAEVQKILDRFKAGTTGMGLIDASQRELFHTGYTSNRARQNVASFLSKHLGIDWRFGAEWYEMMLVDYDVSSNWSNWQYVAGVGNDPRGDARTFNPVKQSFDYDKGGAYVRSWVPEVKELKRLENVFQAWTTKKYGQDKHGLAGNEMVTDPVVRINFSVDRKPRSARRPSPWKHPGRPSYEQGGGQWEGRRGGGQRGGNYNGPRYGGIRRTSDTEATGSTSGNTSQSNSNESASDGGLSTGDSQSQHVGHRPQPTANGSGGRGGIGGRGNFRGYVNGRGDMNGRGNYYTGNGYRGGGGSGGRGRGRGQCQCQSQTRPQSQYQTNTSQRGIWQGYFAQGSHSGRGNSSSRGSYIGRGDNSGRGSYSGRGGNSGRGSFGARGNFGGRDNTNGRDSTTVNE